MNILAIGAHPDDIEIFMYGFLSICKARKDKIDLLVVTDGSAGGDLDPNELAKLRKKETIEGLKRIGYPDFLDIEDAKLSFGHSHYEILNKYLKEKSPDLVVTHSPNDYHADHRTLSNTVSKLIDFRCPILFCDTLMGINFNPEIYIDITQFFDEKKKAILSHSSQNPKKFYEVAKLMNRYRAAQCNAPNGHYAEAYNLYSKFPFVDIKNILPPGPKIRPFDIKSDDSFI